ncbi:Uracil phosphoribosyltransferase [Phytophthora cinnamomi]|uniref:Uracil phosphoribosyltransferase n=1 Tax=Phytophthora cinnamomi TaxID=4785 RepID=UPI003559A3A2|nr:Uracil phosphoribosyltransferase [Phytophthora cinnamomi]
MLTQTAGEVANCLKVLKTNLAEYDKRNGLLFINTSKSFMKSDIRAAKDLAFELLHVADPIVKSDTPSEWEITAARSKINAVSDALGGLKKTALSYDRKDSKPKVIAGIPGNALSGNHCDDEQNSNKNSSSKDKSKSESEGSWLGEDSNGSDSKHNSGSGISIATDTLEALVLQTLHDNFNGSSALKHQVLVAERSLSPPFAERVMDTVNFMTNNSLKGNSNFAPEGKAKKTMSV